MKPNNLTRAIIDATVDRGLREIAEDPQRSIRKLTDMGRRYSSGRFLDEIYALMQDLLRNEDSPYYPAIENLLRHTTRRGLKHFGINLGYNSLTFGGKMIRRLEDQKPYSIPWCLVLRYDPTAAGSVSAADIRQLMMQGNSLGIYSFIIRCTSAAADLTALLDVIAEQTDSSVICMLPHGALDEHDFERISLCTNSLFMFFAGSSFTDQNVKGMQKRKLLYGIYDVYDEDVAKCWMDGSREAEILPYNAAFVILAPSDDCSPRTQKKFRNFVKKLRTQPKYPFIAFDLRGDFMDINKIVSDHPCYFEVLENGGILTSDDTVLEYRHTLSLEQMLAFALPRS